MKIDEGTWEFFQKHLGYSDEEMKLFREDPRNEDVIVKGLGLMKKQIVLEVVASQGCNSQHRVGDKLYFDGAGNLITKRCPERVCVYALSSAAKLIFASNELFFAGADPNDMRFKRVGCFDVGVRCGGWGNIVMELRMEDR